MENSTKIMIAALAGATVGAVTALLFAPASGKETRAKIKEKYDSAKDTLGDLVEKGKKMAENKVEKAKREVEKAKEKVERAKEQVA